MARDTGRKKGNTVNQLDPNLNPTVVNDRMNARYAEAATRRLAIHAGLQRRSFHSIAARVQNLITGLHGRVRDFRVAAGKTSRPTTTQKAGELGWRLEETTSGGTKLNGPVPPSRPA